MRRASLTVTITFALVGLAPSDLLAAEPDTSESEAETDEVPANDVASDNHAPIAEDAAAALVHATAAYEYGDMNQVVEAARPVAEGLLPASPYEQAHAFRLLGIGLYLTDRHAGAETAFTELLRINPKARLNPTTTRPEVVAFFENIRRQYLTRQRRVIWNFIPPVGQFQNDDSTKGWIVLGVGVASFATLVTSRFLPLAWRGDGSTYPGHEDDVETLRTVNWVSAGVLAATYIYGVFDGLIGYSKPIDEGEPKVSLRVFPRGAGVGFAF